MNTVWVVNETKRMIEKELAYKYISVEVDDLVSDGLYWLSSPDRIDKLIKIAQHSHTNFYSYVRSALNRLFTRSATTQAINRSMELPYDPLDKTFINADERLLDETFHYSFESFNTLMQRSDFVEFVLGKPVIVERLSENQLAALHLVYIENIAPKEAYKQAGCSYEAFQDRKYKGLKNLFLSWSSYMADKPI